MDRILATLLVRLMGLKSVIFLASADFGIKTICAAVAKMASHAIFQYNVLAIDDIHNTWTNMIIKMIILRLLGSSDDKEKIDVARPEGPPLRGFRYPVSGRGSNRRQGIGASGGVGRTDAMILWCRRESKPSQPIGTG